MTRGRKPPELLLGETYAAGFRRVALQLAWALPKARAEVRSASKLKRTYKVIAALQSYCDAREEGKADAQSANRREVLWARLQYELKMFNRGERRSVIMIEHYTRARRRVARARSTGTV